MNNYLATGGLCFSNSLYNNFKYFVVATLDRYEVGDISSKFGTLKSKTTDNNNYTDYQMDMYGLNSILGRALVIHRDDAKGSRWVCSNIVPTSAKELSATANFSFTSDLVGTIQLVSFLGSWAIFR